MSEIRLHLLGPVAITHHGTTTPVRSRRASAFLAALGTARGGWVDIHTLSSWMWSTRPPRTAVQQVHTTVSRLRHEFGCITEAFPWVQSGMQGYRLDPAVSVDAGEFESAVRLGQRLHTLGEVAAAAAELRRALAIWSGPCVSLDVGPDAPDVEHLVVLRRLARTLLAQVVLELGEYAEAIAEASLALRDDPYDERACTILVQALVASGRRADAHTACRTVVARLDDELGIDPGHELSRWLNELVPGGRGQPGHGTIAPMVGRW